MSELAQVKILLQSLQQEMMDRELWSLVAIEAEALISQQPFCMDTMNFSQWLQFVFIPRMQALIDAQQVLPKLKKGQGVEPMASEYFKHQPNAKGVISLIRQIDEVLQD